MRRPELDKESGSDDSEATYAGEESYPTREPMNRVEMDFENPTFYGSAKESI